MSTKQRHLIISFLVVLLTLCLRLPYVVQTIISIDEAIYATIAKSIAGGKLLYYNVYEIKPPFIYLLYFFVFKIFGANNLLAIHLVSLFWTLATTYFLFKSASYLYGKNTGYLTALLYTIASTTAFSPADMIAANTELFMVLPLTVSAYYFVRSEKEPAPMRFFLAGIFCGLAMLFKTTGIVNFFVMLFCFLLLFLLVKTPLKKVAGHFLTSLSGLLLPLLLVGIYFWSKGTFKDFYFWVWQYGILYSKQIPLIYKICILQNMMTYLIVTNYIFWTLVLLALFLPSGKKNGGITTSFIWLWGIGSIAAAGFGGRPFDHYYVQVMPPFAILAGLGLSRFMVRIDSLKHRSAGRIIIPILIIFGLTHSILIAHGTDYYRRFRFKKGISAGQNAALYIQKNSSETDRIFVWGFFPEIYLLSQRGCAARFINSDFVVGISPGAPVNRPIFIPGMLELLLEDLEAERPIFIVDTSPTDRFGYANHPISRYPKLEDFIAKNYKPAGQIDNCLIYRLTKQPGH